MQRFRGERLDAFLRAENRTAERMPFPEVLREQLVDQVVGRVLDHLDLFEDDLLLALDFIGDEGRTQDDVGEQIDGKRQVLVEHLDVVAGVFLRGEGVELPADRIDRLRDVLGGALLGAFEEHVLDEMRDAAALVALVPRAPHQPDTDRHRTHMRHRLGDETEPVIEDFASYHSLEKVRRLQLVGSEGIMRRARNQKLTTAKPCNSSASPGWTGPILQPAALDPRSRMEVHPFGGGRRRRAPC